MLAAAEPGGLMHAPDTYLEKLIVGPGGRQGLITDPVATTLSMSPSALGRKVWDITVVILDRPRTSSSSPMSARPARESSSSATAT